jgi:hypothetical protein
LALAAQVLAAHKTLEQVAVFLTLTPTAASMAAAELVALAVRALLPTEQQVAAVARLAVLEHLTTSLEQESLDQVVAVVLVAVLEVLAAAATAAALAGPAEMVQQTQAAEAEEPMTE